MKEFLIGPGDEGIRLDKQLLKILDEAGSGFVYKMLRKKNITLNDGKASGNEHLKKGDVIKIFLSDETFDKFSTGKQLKRINEINTRSSAYTITDMIVFEDEDILIINKPSGLLSQKASDKDISLNELCLAYLKDMGEINDESLKLFKPSICNRLDRNTSGLVIFAKSYKASVLFGDALKDRTIHKYYLCPVKGRVDKEGRAQAYLTKDERSNKVRIFDKAEKGSSKIETAYRPVNSLDEYSLLEVELITGKSHQIRAQMARLGHPLLGDDKYGDRDLNHKLRERFNMGGQVLHAYKLVVPKGKTEEMDKFCGTYLAPLPEDMELLIKELFQTDIKDIPG